MKILIYEEWGRHWIPTGKGWATGLADLGHSVYQISPAKCRLNRVASVFDLMFLPWLPDANTLGSEKESFLAEFKEFRNRSPQTKIIAGRLIPFETDALYADLIDVWISMTEGYPIATKKFNDMGMKNINVPLAGDANLFFPIDQPKLADISFVGTFNHSENRNEDKFLYPVLDLPDIKAITAGFSYKQYPNRQVKHQDLNFVYNATKINLNFHYDNQKGFVDDRIDLNGRTFEIALCGAFQLCDHPLLKRDFGDSIPIGDENNWLDLIRYYLEHDDEREEKAQKAREIVLEKHTWKVRMKQFLEKFNRIMGDE